MDVKRLMVALGAALAISAVITSFFYFRISRQQAAARAKTKQVVAAAADLPAGMPIAAESLKVVDWPETVPLKGLVENKEDVVGRVLIYPVAANEPFLKHDLAAAASFGLTAKIPDGMRATAVRTNEVNNIAGFIFPGSRVDVLVTMRGDANTTFTRTVLQNVQVLSAGTRTEPDPAGKPENVGVITLLATPEQSQKLLLAQNQGSVQFVLRNGNDSTEVETPPVYLAQLSGAPPPTTAVQRPIARAFVPVKPRIPYIVETIAGGKATVTKFERSQPE
jgi:pilus assembly protein CpaB